MLKSAQNQTEQQQQVNPGRQQIETYTKNIAANLQEATRLGQQIINSIRRLQTITDYTDSLAPEVRTRWGNIRKHYEALLFSINNSVTTASNNRHIKYAARPDLALPDAPPANLETANAIYNNLQTQLQQFTEILDRQLLPAMDQGRQVFEQFKDEEWATDYAPQDANWKKTRALGWDLGLTEKRASKIAYPTMHTYVPQTKAPDLDKWKKTAIKMESFRRAYGQNYTFPQILYHFTKDWDMFERFGFKKWFNWTHRKASKKMEKSADHLAQDRMQQFTQKRKRLVSRINLVRKALYEMINNGLIDPKASDKLSKILYMLEHESMRLTAPKIAAARVRRAARLLSKDGFTEGGDLLKKAAEEFLNGPTPIVKTAQPKHQEAVGLLKKIKREMDILSYSKHLDSLFHIKKELEKMGRAGDAEAVEKIIRDDLSVLEKLNKKLIEVYTNLSRVPLELSDREDEFGRDDEPKEKVMETPLEVTEEEAEPEQRRPARPLGQPQVAPRRPTPAIQTEGVPNV